MSHSTTATLHSWLEAALGSVASGAQRLLITVPAAGELRSHSHDSHKHSLFLRTNAPADFPYVSQGSHVLV